MTSALEMPESRLPRQVRERADKARAMLANGQDPAPADPPKPAEPVTPDPPPQAAPANDEIPPAVTPDDPRYLDPKYWQQRFNVAEGIFKSKSLKAAAEVARARREEQLAHERIATLEKDLETTRNELEQARQVKADSTEVDLTQLFTAEEIATLGEDAARIHARAILSQAQKIARETVSREIEPLKRQQSEAQEARRRTAQERFLEALQKLVPDWAQVDSQESWLAFLELDDPETGIWRQTIVDNAKARGDAQPVANLIAQWRKEQKPAATPPAPPVPPNPSMGSGAGMPPPDPVPTVRGHPTKAEVRDYYKRKAIGKISEQETKEFEARLEAARKVGIYL